MLHRSGVNVATMYLAPLVPLLDPVTAPPAAPRDIW